MTAPGWDCERGGVSHVRRRFRLPPQAALLFVAAAVTGRAWAVAGPSSRARACGAGHAAVGQSALERVGFGSLGRSFSAAPRQGGAHAGVAMAAAGLLVAAAVVGEKKAKPVITAPQLVERLFRQGKKSFFGSNVWYESPETTRTNQDRVWEYWQVRPTREIERICDGRTSCGCTWKQLDGRRGASFFRFNNEGKITYVREVVEPAEFTKFRSNNMASLKPVLGVMGGIQKVFNFAEGYLQVAENSGPARPRLGLASPKSRRAQDIAIYLWEEAYVAENDAIERVVAEYSDDAVWEDMTYVDEMWAKGKEAVRKYMEETKTNAPENLRFVLDEISDGDRACAVVWHVEFGGQKTPRGVSFYELDADRKVSYVRASYDLSF